jgi:hypothetical protein
MSYPVIYDNATQRAETELNKTRIQDKLHLKALTADNVPERCQI